MTCSGDSDCSSTTKSSFSFSGSFGSSPIGTSGSVISGNDSSSFFASASSSSISFSSAANSASTSLSSTAERGVPCANILLISFSTSIPSFTSSIKSKTSSTLISLCNCDKASLPTFIALINSASFSLDEMVSTICNTVNNWFSTLDASLSLCFRSLRRWIAMVLFPEVWHCLARRKSLVSSVSNLVLYRVRRSREFFRSSTARSVADIVPGSWILSFDSDFSFFA
mmetsp:Transcript_53166/g.78909  ORF Transcript_53166/g.78909 Transcript_53166/m.78909 type:complete len:226 (+) Transcript_53166:46-723(+)